MWFPFLFQVQMSVFTVYLVTRNVLTRSPSSGVEGWQVPTESSLRAMGRRHAIRGGGEGWE